MYLLEILAFPNFLNEKRIFFNAELHFMKTVYVFSIARSFSLPFFLSLAHK